MSHQSRDAAAFKLQLTVGAAAKHDGCAIIVQLGETGPILAAAIVPLKKGGW